MSLVDFIVPRWRHSNPEIRMAAVREMAAEKLDTLERIALTDPDAGVRTAAVDRIEDGTRLEEIAAGATDDAVKKAAEDGFNRLYHDRLMVSGERKERLILLDKLTDEKRLADIAADLDDMDVRMIALARVTRPDLLCKVAERHCGPAVGSEVVTRLDDPQLLKRLARNATNKKVRRQAGGKLGLLTQREEADTPDRDLSARADLEACCRRLESLLAEERWPEYPAALADALTTWEAHDPDETHPLRERFQGAAQAIEARLATFQRRGEIQSALENLCNQTEAVAGETEKGALPPETALKRIEDFRNRWGAIDSGEVPGPLLETLSVRFRKACGEAEAAAEQRRIERAEAAARRQDRLVRLEALIQAAEALADGSPEEVSGGGGDQWDPLRTEWRAIAAGEPSEAPLEERFEAASRRYHERMEKAARRAAEAAREQEERLHALCETVEAAIAAEERLGLEKRVRAAQAEWKAVGGVVPQVRDALSERFEGACDRFFRTQREYRENAGWERFANLTQKEELCVIVEALAESGALDGLPEMVREVQNRWKGIGPVSREKSEPLWHRFRTACERAYGRCLAEKETLAAEARDLVAGVPDPEGFSSAADWEAVSDALKALQARWKAIGPLPRSLETPLFEEFQSGCNRFFERRRLFYQGLDVERKENLARKRALCEEAASLSSSEEWTAAAGRLKELQRRWKSVGPVPREESDRLWNRFQTACNTFFNRLEAARPGHLARKQALCREVESLAASVTEKNIRETAQKIMALQEEWKRIGPVPEEEAEPLWERFRLPCDRFFEQYRDHVQALRAQQQENRRHKEALVSEAESLAESTRWKETGDRLKALQKRWQEIGPAPRKSEQALWERFRSACDAFFSRRDDHFARRDRDRSRDLDIKEEICLRIEVLAQLAAPEQAPEFDAADRAAERVRIGFEYRDGVIVPGDRKSTWDNVLKTVRSLQAEWNRGGPVPGEDFRRLDRRYRRAMAAFYPPKPKSVGERMEDPPET